MKSHSLTTRESKLQATSTLIKDIDNSKKTEGLKTYYKLVTTDTNSDDSKTAIECGSSQTDHVVTSDSNKLNENSNVPRT